MGMAILFLGDQAQGLEIKFGHGLNHNLQRPIFSAQRVWVKKLM